jgi:hypothetical protein
MASTEFATGSRRSASAGFLFVLGFVLVATGAGFAFAPQYSWQATRVARVAGELGIHSGALVVGGLVLFGMGLVARVAAAASSGRDRSDETESLRSELHILNEQLSAKLGQLRASVMQVGEGLAAVSAQQQAQLQGQGDRSDATDHAQDAVFRLAASLDKLHAHLDERVHAVDLQLRSGFESLLNASYDLRRQLEQRPAVAAHPVHVEPGSNASSQPQPVEGGIDFYETMQKFDAIAGSSGVQPDLGSQPQAPFPSQGQGDALDALLPEDYRDRY